MHFSTIWTSGYPLKEKIARTRDWAASEVGARLPLRVRYWVTLQMMGKATMTSPNVQATPLDEILRNLDTPKSLA